MISEAVLARAVARGLLSDGQASALRSLAREEEPEPAAAPEPVDEERLRFVTGFADIFVTIGLALFLGSAAYLLGLILPAGASAGAVAALAWGLAEFFTRVKRMALPSIALLCVFAFAGFVALGEALEWAGLGAAPARSAALLDWLGGALRGRTGSLAAAFAALGTAGLTALHYLRFRVPITVAAGVAALAVTSLAFLSGAAPDVTQRALNPILLALGLAIFALAMAFDLSDPARVTRRTDIAFWLHLLASPLVVHSVFQMIGAGSVPSSAATALGTIGVFLALAAVAVLVDRRAMLVSGLVYAGTAFGSLVASVGLARGIGLPLTLLALGTFVLLLSAGWTPLRRTALRFLPSTMAARLPRPLPT